MGAAASRRVTFFAVNDVYKLVGVPNALDYYYLKEDLSAVRDVTAASCDGQKCGSDLASCGFGPKWESCFPLDFDTVRELNMKTDRGPEALPVATGPCGASPGGPWTPKQGETYGGIVDFAATFKWMKEDTEARGDVAIGTLAGDFIGPSFLAGQFEGKQLVEIMNHMGVDLVNIGNHDVDYKLKVLREQMTVSAFHYLNANLVDLADDSEIEQPMTQAETVQGNDFVHPTSAWRNVQAHGRGWAALDYGEGLQVCILGTTDVDKMIWKGKAIKSIERDIPATIQILKAWKDDGLACHLKVAITHTRTGNDMNLFRAVEDAGLHLDAIIGGHDHYAAYAAMTRSDGGTTFMVKAGADARVIAKLTFDMQAKGPQGSLELVPVVHGECAARREALGEDRVAWLDKAETLFDTYAKIADDMNKIKLNVLYRGVYDTNIVRDGESRAVNLWLDMMKESLSADLLFFQAGLVRQDMLQDNGAEGDEMTKLSMLEEFPWNDIDSDWRSSLFPFEVSVADLMANTVPFLARTYWCNAPFNDANRIHVSGLIIESVNGNACSKLPADQLIQSVTFVGRCHTKGGLDELTSECCTSPLCGRWWTAGAWDERMTPELQQATLSVLTGQFCVPSKYGSHGAGFHEAGMMCKDAEAEANWASGAEFAKSFAKPGVAPISETYSEYAKPVETFTTHGYFFKQSMLSMLQKRETKLLVGNEGEEECSMAASHYRAGTFLRDCRCEQQVLSREECGRMPRSNGFARLYAAPAAAFVDAPSDPPGDEKPWHHRDYVFFIIGFAAVVLIAGAFFATNTNGRAPPPGRQAALGLAAGAATNEAS